MIITAVARCRNLNPKRLSPGTPQDLIHIKESVMLFCVCVLFLSFCWLHEIRRGTKLHLHCAMFQALSSYSLTYALRAYAQPQLAAQDPKTHSFKLYLHCTMITTAMSTAHILSPTWLRHKTTVSNPNSWDHFQSC